MKKFTPVLVFLFCTTLFCETPIFGQNNYDASFDIEIKVTPEQQAKIDTALAALLIVQTAGHYIKSLKELSEYSVPRKI